MEEFLETAIPSDEAIEAAWEEEEFAGADDTDWLEPEPEADQQTEQTAGTHAGAEQPNGKNAQGGGPGTDQSPAFTLKHLGQVRTVGRDEVVKLAQQGMDYERVRAERDQLRAYREETNPALTLIKSYAEKSGMNVEQYIDSVRKAELMKSGINEQTAGAQIALEKQQASLRAQEAGRREQERRTAKLASISRFLRTYPSIKAGEIPKEVWQSVFRGEDLSAAYTFHKNRLLEAELAAERQNRENARKSVGSMSTRGAARQDEIDKWWYEDD